MDQKFDYSPREQFLFQLQNFRSGTSFLAFLEAAERTENLGSTKSLNERDIIDIAGMNGIGISILGDDFCTSYKITFLGGEFHSKEQFSDNKTLRIIGALISFYKETLLPVPTELKLNY